jgi:hypothetical protein
MRMAIASGSASGRRAAPERIQARTRTKLMNISKSSQPHARLLRVPPVGGADKKTIGGSDRGNSRVRFALPAALGVLIALGLVAATAGTAAAARVSGSFATYRGQPAPGRDLHFENCVTQDSFLAPTHRDGSFAQTLPLGCYDLRTERGAIVRHEIMVGEANLAIGQVNDLAPLAPARLFDLEALFPTLLTSPAPSTAYIFTRDTTVVPASAPKVPMPSPTTEWRGLKHENAAAGADKLGPGAPVDFGGKGMFSTAPSKP